MYNTNFSASNPVQTNDEYSFEGADTMKNKKSSFSLSSIIGAIVFGVLVLGVVAANLGSSSSEQAYVTGSNEVANTEVTEQQPANDTEVEGQVAGVQVAQITKGDGFGGDGETPIAPPAGGYSIRCSSQGTQSGSTFNINWNCWGDDHMQWARPDRIDWPGYPAAKPWKIAGWHCPQPNTSDPNNPKTCNYGDPGAIRVFMTDKNTLNYAQGKRDGQGGDGSPCSIDDPDQTHCVYYNVTSSSITASAYNNCGYFQADIFVPHPDGHTWDFGGTRNYQVLGAFTHDFGNYTNCGRSTPTPTPSPTPTPGCPLYGAPTVNCMIDQSTGRADINVQWTAIPGATSYTVRADHRPGTNNQCFNPTTAPDGVGWYCPKVLPAGYLCNASMTCDDRMAGSVTGTQRLFTNVELNLPYRVYVQQNGGQNCATQSRDVTCRWTPTNTASPSPSATPSPTPTPSVTPSPTPSPTPELGPMCLGIARTVTQSIPNDPNPNTPDVGEYVKFTCDQITGWNVNYEFRWMRPDGVVETLNQFENVGNETLPYLVSMPGQYHAQCRVCVQGSRTCQDFEPFPTVQGAYTETSGFNPPGDPAEFDSINEYVQQ